MDFYIIILVSLFITPPAPPKKNHTRLSLLLEAFQSKSARSRGDSVAKMGFKGLAGKEDGSSVHTVAVIT